MNCLDRKGGANHDARFDEATCANANVKNVFVCWNPIRIRYTGPIFHGILDCFLILGPSNQFWIPEELLHGCILPNLLFDLRKLQFEYGFVSNQRVWGGFVAAGANVSLKLCVASFLLFELLRSRRQRDRHFACKFFIPHRLSYLQ